MANKTVQLLPLKKRTTQQQQENRAVRIAARAHARDILTTELLTQRRAIVQMHQTMEARRPINIVKRLVAAPFAFLRRGDKKQQATNAPVVRAKNFTMRRMGS